MRDKITVVGAGNVGASLAQMVAQSGLADVVLIDVVEGIPQGKALDMSQACSLWGSSATVTGTNDYADTAGSSIVAITAGLARKPGMSRDDLLAANAKIVGGVTAEIAKHSPECIIVVVTNPMDVMAYLALKESGFESRRVIGMGGVLDSSRFRTFVAWELGVSARDVEALVMGGHGDSMVPMPSQTTVKGISITQLMPAERVEALIERTKNGGAEIVAHLKTGSAYYAPAASTFEMIKSILLDERRTLPCSVYLEGQYGINGVYAGVPTVLGKNGVEKVVEIKLAEGEQALLEKSANAVDGLIKALGK